MTDADDLHLQLRLQSNGRPVVLLVRGGAVIGCWRHDPTRDPGGNVVRNFLTDTPVEDCLEPDESDDEAWVEDSPDPGAYAPVSPHPDDYGVLVGSKRGGGPAVNAG